MKNLRKQIRKIVNEVFQADVALEDLLFKVMGNKFLDNRKQILDNVYTTLGMRTINWAFETLSEDYPELEGYQDEFYKAAEKEGYFLMDKDKWDDNNFSESLKYHLENRIPIYESVYRYGSDEFINLVNECKKLVSEGVNIFDEIEMDFLMEQEIEKVKLKDGKEITLGVIFEEFELNEAEYKGREVELNKPKRGGEKKFYVYVKNPKTGKVKKVSFGAKDGGQNLSVKLKDPKARKNFAKRHRCHEKNDKTKPGYWSCRIARYAKLLNLSGGGTWW
jgi:hypothetical protein